MRIHRLKSCHDAHSQPATTFETVLATAVAILLPFLCSYYSLVPRLPPCALAKITEKVTLPNFLCLFSRVHVGGAWEWGYSYYSSKSMPTCLVSCVSSSVEVSGHHN